MKQIGIMAACVVAMATLWLQPASANVITTASVNCTGATWSWRDFPNENIVFDVIVTQPGSQGVHTTASSGGQSSGTTSVSFHLTGNGTINLRVTARVAEPKTATTVANCVPATTTTVPPTTSTVPPTTTTTTVPKPAPKPAPPSEVVIGKPVLTG